MRLYIVEIAWTLQLTEEMPQRVTLRLRRALAIERRDSTGAPNACVDRLLGYASESQL